MRTIEVKELTKEGFAKYGVYQNLLCNEELYKVAVSGGGFFPDVVWMDFGGQNLPTVSVCYVEKQEKNVISFVEAHQHTCEGLVPLDADVIIYVGTMGRDFNLDSIEAFRVPKGTFVKLNPLIVHGCQFVRESDEAHLICMLPARTFKNDMIFKVLSEEEQIQVL